MAFKMKKPSLLKMVKQMREGTPMKEKPKTYSVAIKSEDLKTGDLTYEGDSFENAFADARKSGARTFTYDGKKYTTKMKGEKDMVKIPKKKIKPLPVKTDVKLKEQEDRPDPTFEGTDEFRSLDEIRRDSKNNR